MKGNLRNSRRMKHKLRNLCIMSGIIVFLIFLLWCFRMIHYSARAAHVSAWNNRARFICSHLNKELQNHTNLDSLSSFYIWGESGLQADGGEYELMYGGEIIPEDIFLFGNEAGICQYHWAVKIETGVCTEAWVSSNILTEEKLRPYTEAEQKTLLSLRLKMPMVDTSELIGYYQAMV